MEKNFAIYNEMRAAAERVFNEGINAPAGVYSFAELAKVGTTCKTAPAGVYFREDYNIDELININVDGFECNYPARLAFVIGYKFERLAKVGAKARAAFQRAADHGEPVAVFTLDATTCDSLAACDDPRNTLRPALACVFVDLAAGLAVCCDSYIMNVTHIKDVSIINNKSLINGGVLIPRDFAKAAKGCKVSIFKNDLDLIAVASDGNSCTLVRETYPNYKAVFEYTEKKAAAPVRLVKNVRELKKTAAAVAKVAACDVVYISGMNGDEYITLSANCDGGEISRRVALSSGLTFNFATALKVASIKSINNAADTLYISYFNTIVFAGAKVVGLVNPSYDSDNVPPTAAAAEKIATKVKDFCNVYKDFTAPAVPADSIQTVDSTDTADTLDVAPVEDVTEDSDNTEHVAPVEDVTEDNDNAEHVAPVEDVTEDNDNAEHVAPVEDVTEDSDNAEHVAPVEDVTEDSDNAEHVAPVEDVTEDSDNTEHVAPVEDVAEYSDNTEHVAPVEDVTEDNDNAEHVTPRCVWLDWLKVAAVLLLAFVIRSVSTSDSNAVAPSINSRAAVVDVEPLQAVEILDTLDVAPVAPVDSIQATEGNNEADTLDVAPVAPVDSIQATEGNNNADTIDVAPVAPVDSIQATEGDNADTLDVAPVAPADSIQATEGDNADMLNVAPVAPVDSIQATEGDNADTLDVAPVAPVHPIL